MIINHDNKIKDIENIDNIIYTKILDYNINLDLYNIVINIIMHDSCDSAYSNSLYIINKKYLKKYSHKFCDEMISNEKSYLIY